METVGIASCSHWAWLESSRTMVNALAQAVGFGTVGRVHAPIEREGLIACMQESNHFIIHTHGSANGFFDQRADNRQTIIATLSDVHTFPRFPNLHLIVITACEAAGGVNEENIACALSTRIAQDGLVIANRFDVFGSDYDFGEKHGKRGWVAYQNGKLALCESQIPANITMADAYQIYINHKNGRA
ncbi:MAG: hypothetical protein IKZ28_04495 [Clostridia bacterium]|nr:hypothetical protein [Clostridia bacterium]